MKHLFIDEYSNIDSFLHRLDPRTKIIIFFTFILFVVLTPTVEQKRFLLYFFLLLFFIFLSKVPFMWIVTKSLVIIPFVILVTLFSGLEALRDISIKAFLSIVSLILLASSTSFPNLLKGFEKLGLPKVITSVLSFMYRYTYVSIDELMRMKRAKDARTIAPKRVFEAKTLANLIGNLFIRSYNRGERVYLAMCSRGFDGKIRTLNSHSFRLRDAIFGFGTILLLVVIIFI